MRRRYRLLVLLPALALFPAVGQARPEGDLPAPVLSPSASLSGTVVDEQGRPVAGARVQAVSWRGFQEGEKLQARTSPAGIFQITGLRDTPAYRVMADHPGFAPSAVETLGASGRSGIRIVLRPGSTLRGTLVDEAGHPVEDAEVTLARATDEGLAHGPAQTGGAFTLSDLPAGFFELRIERPGAELVRRPGIEILPGQRVDLGRLVILRGETLAGRVTDPAGQPIAKVEVRIETGSGPQDALTAVTSLDGTFAVRGLAPHPKKLVVEICAEGFLQEHRVLDSLPPEPLLLALSPAASLSGTVVDTAGSPVADAHLMVQRGGYPEDMSSRCASGRAMIAADAKGRFTFSGLKPGWHTVVASARHFLQTRNEGVEVRPGKDRSGVRIVLRRGASLSGRITDPSGAPVHGVHVYAQAQESGTTGDGWVDGDGRYSLDSVETGKALVGAQGDGFQDFQRKTEIAPGDNTLDITLIPRDHSAEHPVHGFVTGPEGRPVAAASVDTDGAWTQTAADGSFTLSLPDGPHEIRVSKEEENYAPGGVTANVDVQGAPVEGLEIHLPPPAELTGHILGLDPAEAAWARIDAAPGTVPDYDRAGSVAPDGSYRLPRLGPGDWRVRAGAGDHEVIRMVHLAPGERHAVLDLELASLREVRGRVLGPDGEPVPRAKLSVSRDQSTAGWATSWTDGSFHLRLPDGEYAVSASAPGYASTAEPLPVTVAGRPVDALVIRMARGASLHGRILGLAPGEVPWVQASGPVSVRGEMEMDGTYHISGLRPGTWKVKAELLTRAHRTATAAVTVQEGDSDLSLDLEFAPQSTP